MTLPFELYKNHKALSRCNWRQAGLICTEEEFEVIYYMYICSSHCDLCNNEFKKRSDRQMEHSHQTGEFRNIVCQSCNLRKYDVKMNCNNTTGYSGIIKEIDKRYKQGFIWRFQLWINGKQKKIKSSIYKEKLIKFADKWKIDNNWNT